MVFVHQEALTSKRVKSNWTLIAALTISFVGFVGTAPDAAALVPAKKFSSCKALWKKYPNGVAENRQAAREVIQQGYMRPAINRTVYLANYRQLDDDYTGVICPRMTQEAFDQYILDNMQQDICRGMDVIGTPMNQRPSYCQR